MRYLFTSAIIYSKCIQYHGTYFDHVYTVSSVILLTNNNNDLSYQLLITQVENKIIKHIYRSYHA